VARRVKKLPLRSARIELSAAGKTAGDTGAAASGIHASADKVFKVTARDEVANAPPEDAAQADGFAGFAQEGSQNIFRPMDGADVELIPPTAFDEVGYLRLNPDVREAIELGQLESGYAHYVLHGHAERRPVSYMPTETRNVMLTSVGTAQSGVAPLRARCSIDSLLVAAGSGLMIVGWIDDVAHPLSCIRIISAGWRVVMDASRFVRTRRMDVEDVIGSRVPHALGFFGFLQFEHGGDLAGPLNVELWQDNGVATALQCGVSPVGDIELRNAALAYLANASFYGNASIESMGYLEQGVGAELIQFNKAITRRLVSSPFVERFGPELQSPRGSIIVCLYGRPEYYFVQNCLFAGLPGIEEYEFIYVSNSPDMAETLLREAQSASQIYGLTNSVMILGGNAGFGGANNAAARMARSNRLLIVNPDVFPRDRDWAKKHTNLLQTATPEQTRLFGVPLYYDDGSLMHGGMYFETDVGVTMASGTPNARQMCRVEHYGKGAPAESPQFTRPRPVPAVTGAFLSIESEWFAELGGFTEDFVFGHYEDADLCLKSIEKGVAPWLQDIRMWHLEGKGSNREPAHEGGSMVNRWLFSQTWMDMIEAGLRGPTPSHALFRPPSLRASTSTNNEPPKPKADSRRRVFR
jgi:GT2 family glycosyltransferase